LLDPSHQALAEAHASFYDPKNRFHCLFAQAVNTPPFFAANFTLHALSGRFFYCHN
jgi:hypothetical protein